MFIAHGVQCVTLGDTPVSFPGIVSPFRLLSRFRDEHAFLPWEARPVRSGSRDCGGTRRIFRGEPSCLLLTSRIPSISSASGKSMVGRIMGQGIRGAA